MYHDWVCMMTNNNFEYGYICWSLTKSSHSHYLRPANCFRSYTLIGSLEKNTASESVRMSQRLSVVQDPISSMRRSPKTSNKSLLDPRPEQGSMFSSRHGSCRSGYSGHSSMGSNTSEVTRAKITAADIHKLPLGGQDKFDLLEEIGQGTYGLVHR